MPSALYTPTPNRSQACNVRQANCFNFTATMSKLFFTEKLHLRACACNSVHVGACRLKGFGKILKNMCYKFAHEQEPSVHQAAREAGAASTVE